MRYKFQQTAMSLRIVKEYTSETACPILMVSR